MRRGTVLHCGGLIAACLFAIQPATLDAQTPFTYQGRLLEEGVPVSGNANLRFSLWDSPIGGALPSAQIIMTDVSIEDGLFNVMLDFGDMFDGSEWYLEIDVRMPGNDKFETLQPRTPLHATPHAHHARRAGKADTVADESVTSPSIAGGSIERQHFATGLRNTLDSADGSIHGAVHVNDAGRVGIGTGSPGAVLHIEADTDMLEPVSGDLLRLIGDGADRVLAARMSNRDPFQAFGNAAQAMFHIHDRGDSRMSLELVLDTVGQAFIAGSDFTFARRPGGVRFGIATDNPQAALHVGSGISNDNSLFTGSSVSGTRMRIENTSPGGGSFDLTATGQQNFHGPGRLLIGESGVPPIVTLTSNDRIGIGRSDPERFIHVMSGGTYPVLIETTSNSGTHMTIRNSGSGGEIFHLASTGASHPEGGGRLLMGHGSSLSDLSGTAIAIDSGNRVGIGHGSPTTQLHVRSGGFAAQRIEGSSSVGTWLTLQNTADGGRNFHMLSTGPDNGGGAGLLQIGTGTGPTAYSGTAISVNDSRQVGIMRNVAEHPLHVGSSVGNGNGAHVTATGVWVNGSSREFKTDFRKIDPVEVLDRLAALPITQWRYKESETEHIGPTAEDFRMAFGLGHDERYIGTVDASGVAMAAIQGLHFRLDEREQRIAELERANSDLEARLARLEAVVAQGR